MRLFQNLTDSFREDFLGICLCSYSQVAPIHHSHVHRQIKISLPIFERGHSRNISVNWELEATSGDSARIQDDTTENSAWFFNVLRAPSHGTSV